MSTPQEDTPQNGGRGGGVSAPEKHQALWTEARPFYCSRWNQLGQCPEAVPAWQGPLWGYAWASGLLASWPSVPLQAPLLNQDDTSPATGPKPRQWCQRMGKGRTETWDTDHISHTAQHVNLLSKALWRSSPGKQQNWDPHPCQPTQPPGALFSMPG